MRIKDHRYLAFRIAQWLYVQLKTGNPECGCSRGHFKAVIGISGGIDSALVALLCKYAGLEVVCVNMPCHSSTWSIDRSVSFTADYGLKMISVNATDAADSISWQVEDELGIKEPDRGKLGGLFSCIRAPVLDYVAKCVGGRIIGTGNRDEDYIVRYFSKRGDGAVDISPIADLHKSEVRQLFLWLATEMNEGVLPESASKILSAKPSADLWGGQEQYDEDELGLTYDQVEWVDRFVSNKTKDADCYEFWALSRQRRELFLNRWLKDSSCTPEEAEVIRKVSDIELATKHKANPNIPVCKVHYIYGVFE